MEIEEIQKLKAKLETDIKELLWQFEVKTGLCTQIMDVKINTASDRFAKQEKEEKMDLVIFETHDCRSIMAREEAEDKVHTEARYFAVASLITKRQKEFKDLWGEEYEKLKKVRIVPGEKYK